MIMMMIIIVKENVQFNERKIFRVHIYGVSSIYKTYFSWGSFIYGLYTK